MLKMQVCLWVQWENLSKNSSLLILIYIIDKNHIYLLCIKCSKIHVYYGMTKLSCLRYITSYLLKSPLSNFHEYTNRLPSPCYRTTIGGLGSDLLADPW